MQNIKGEKKREGRERGGRKKKIKKHNVSQF
jgi:hypothetical protein